MMSYKEMVYNAPKDKETMWKSIANVSCFMEKMWGIAPKEVKRFLYKEYGNMYQPHFYDKLAHEEVNAMMHKAKDGNVIKGEVITIEEASAMIPAEKREMLMWDAYVAFNGFAHDTAHAELSKKDMMNAAYSYWFMDDDFTDTDTKVWWYYSNL